MLSIPTITLALGLLLRMSAAAPLVDGLVTTDDEVTQEWLAEHDKVVEKELRESATRHARAKSIKAPYGIRETTKAPANQ